MNLLLSVSVAAAVGYVVVTGIALYVLSRFSWLTSVREVRPRQLSLHLLSYGGLLAYLLLCVWGQQQPHAARNEALPTWSALQSKTRERSSSTYDSSDVKGILSWLRAIFIVSSDAVVEAFLRPWTPTANTSSAAPPSLPRLLLSNTFYASVQAIAATCLYGTFAVLGNARWRYTALRTTERHPALWAALFPTSAGEKKRRRRQPQDQMDGSMDSLTWNSQGLPPMMPVSASLASSSGAAPHRNATRRVARVSVVSPNARLQSRFGRPLSRSQLSLPQFNNSSSSGASGVNASVGLTVPPLHPGALGPPPAEAAEGRQEQRRILLRLRQHFMSAFWLSDATVLLTTLSVFSSLAASRVVVTLAVASMTMSATPAGGSSGSGATFIAAPTEGYVALIGCAYVAVLQWRLRRKHALLQDLLHHFSSDRLTDATTGAAPSPQSLASVPLPRQRRVRAAHSPAAGSSGGRSGLRTGLRRTPHGSLPASSPLSPVTPTDLLYKPGFDDATFSGMVTPSPQDPAHVTLETAALQHTPSAAFYLNPDDRVGRAAESSAASSSTRARSPSQPAKLSTSFFARWSFRLLPLRRDQQQQQPAEPPSPALCPSTFTAASTAAATGAAAAATTAHATMTSEPTMPHARYLLLVSAALIAVQLCPDSTNAWAVSLVSVSVAAIGTAQHCLLRPLCWIMVDYRGLLQCSWWTLLVSRSFTPRSMDVSKAVRGLSQQQQRHLMMLRAAGSHHAHPSATIEEDEDWVTEEANGSFAANALVAAATAAPPPPPSLATRPLMTTTAAGGAGGGPTTTVTPDFLISPRAADSVDTASLSTSSAATAVAILGGNTGGVLEYFDDMTPAMDNADDCGDDGEDDDFNDDSGCIASGVSGAAGASCSSGGGGGGGGAVTAIPPAQFWHGVAAKVLQQSAANAERHHNGGESGSGGGGGCVNSSFAGPASTTLTGSFAGLPPLPGIGVGMVQVAPHGTDTPTAAVANTSFLGVVDPFRVITTPTIAPTPTSSTATSSANVIATALLPETPGMEGGSSTRTAFRRESMTGSMLLTAPAAARVGAAAEAAAEAEAERQREAERLLREAEEDEEAAMLAANAARVLTGQLSESDDEANDNDNDHHAGSLSRSYRFAAYSPAAPTGSDGADQQQQQQQRPHSPTTASAASGESGWLSRALATVVPGIVGQRSRAGSSSSAASHVSHHNSAAAAPSTPPEPFTSELPADVVHSLSFAGSFSGAASATARALLHSEEGFARFLRCVRRDGDNTYALQGLLASHGHTYARRVDAKGRSALHYAVMGGFVHGVWFLINIGAEPNLLDKAGYAPLHYAVLYHTEHCLSPTITDENGSLAVQGARHMLGIPVVGTASVQAPEQARKRRALRQQRQRRQMQERLQAAYTAESSSSSAHGGSRTTNNTSTTSETSGLERDADATNAADQNSRRSSGTHNNASSSTPLGVPEEDGADGSLLHLLPTGVHDEAEDETTTTTLVAAPVSSVAVVAAAAMAQEERGQWYGMAGRLLSLGAQVDFPTARGLTALHLAVLQGSIGLINTLLREGANPLLGSELETPSFLATANAAPSDEEEEGEGAAAEQPDSSVKWIAQIHAEFQRPGARRRQQQQQQRDKEKEGEVGGSGRHQQQLKEGGNGVPPPSSTSDPPSCGSQSSAPSTTTAHSAAAIVRKALLARQTEWVEVHITNAGNPIAKGHCKSPLLLAVELDADLAVASMLHHATLQATTAASVLAGLPSGSRATLGRDGRQEDDSGRLPASTIATSHLPASPLSNTGVQLLPPRPPSSSAAAAAAAGGTTTTTSSNGGAVTSSLSAPRSMSAYSQEQPSCTAAYPGSGAPSQPLPAALTSQPHSPQTQLSASANPLAGGPTATHVSFSDAVTTASPATASTLLPLPTAITAVESHANNTSMMDVLLPASPGVTAETIATTITAMASTRARLCWERPCAHAFNPVHVALVLGNAQVTRVLLLRWAYDGTARGGALLPSASPASAAEARATPALSRSNKCETPLSPGGAAAAVMSASRTPSGAGQAPASGTASAVSPLLSSFPLSLANAAETSTAATTITAEASAPLQPTVAQITVPVFDDGENMAFLSDAQAVNASGAGTIEEKLSSAAAAADGVDAASTPSSHNHHQHNHHHHHPHSHHHNVQEPATATLSLLTSIGASAFWVAPLRLNFFHLAAIGDSTECLAYVLRWRGVPDYVPCALDDAFHDGARAEEARRDAEVKLSATAAQDAYHQRRLRYRQQKKLGNHHNTRELAGVASPLRPCTASTTVEGSGHLDESASALRRHTAEQDSRNPNSADAHLESGGRELDGVPQLLEDDFPESPSTSSSSSSSAASGRPNNTTEAPHTTATPAAAGAVAAEGKTDNALPPTASFFSAPLTKCDAAAMAAARDLEAATVSSTVSDLFNRTWSSGLPSCDTASSGTAAPFPSRFSLAHAAGGLPTPTTKRAHRLRARQHTFMRALVTLLQTNLRRDAARRRVRTTVFGRGGAGGVLRYLSKPGPGGEAGAGAGEGGSSTAAAAASAALAGDSNSVMAQTCFGSPAAAAALHTGMTICYATMNNLLHDEPCGDVTDDDSSSTSSSSSSAASASVSDAAQRSPEQVRGAGLVRGRRRERRRHRQQQKQQQQAQLLREEARLQHLRQQRRRAFVSAVAKLRQSIVGVPIDIAHLAAVEMAVDRACAALPTAKARRTLQQALLIVTRRLQNQRRRQYLMDGMRQSAAATTTTTTTAGRGSLCLTQGSDAAGDEGSFSTATTTTTTTTTADSHAIASSRDTPKMQQERQRQRSAVRESSGRGQQPQQQQSPSMATSAPSYYSTGERHGGGSMMEAGDRNDGDEAAVDVSDTGAATAELRRERLRRFQQQQRLLQLLSALATELNAVDTRGLTPLHYAIANQNASMVYLLCAYGATFIFASPQTEEHLVGHPVEVVAAAAVAAYEGGEADAGGVVSSATSASDVEGGRGVVNGASTLSTTASTVTVTPNATFAPPRGSSSGATGSKPSGAWTFVNVKDAAAGAGSPSASSPLFSPAAASSPASLATVRAQLAAPAITVATDVLSFFSEQHFTQLTPATQEALRRAAKTGSAEYLLLRLPTRAEQAMERQALAQDLATRHAAEGGAVGGTGAPSQRHHASLPPFAPSAPPPAAAAAVAMASSPPSSCSSFSSPLTSHQQQQQQQQHQPPALKTSFTQPTTMAATLTEALGLGVNGSFTAAAATSALSAVPWEGDATDRKHDTPSSAAGTPVDASGKSPSFTTEDGLQGLQAQLVDQEGMALQRMVGGGGDGTLRGSVHGSSTNNSIAIPLPSSATPHERRGGGSGFGEEDHMGGMMAMKDADRQSGTSPPSSSGAAAVTPFIEQIVSLDAPPGKPASNSAASASLPADSGVAAPPLSTDGWDAGTDYAVLEPHDVFLTHMVRNPARADSIVRAAMEGTALRYLFQATIASSPLDT